MKPSVYIETSIPSFYHEIRTDITAQARRSWTREWWKNQRQLFEVVSSEAVMDELSDGEYAKKQDCLDFMDSVVLLDITEEITEIVRYYIQHKIMPSDPLGDALHLAIASFHKCDFLMTWNCKHLANANKFGHIRRVNTVLGLYVPAIVTPLEFLEDYYE